MKGLGNIHASHCLRLVAINYEYGYKYAMLPNKGNVKLHVCAKFHDHSCAVLYAHSKV